MRRAMFGLGAILVGVPLLLGVLYLAAVRWAPMDAVTIELPQAVRNTISRTLVARANFDAKGFPEARRAVRLNPWSEDAWTTYCSTGAREGKHVGETLRACSRAEAMNSVSDYSSFHAQVIAEAYEETQRPCDGLPILKKTMGPEKSNNISPIFSVARLEITCGQMDDAEKHLRTVVRLWQDDMRDMNWEDRPPNNDGKPDTYEKFFRLSLSKARQNLSALLTLRNQDDEAFRMCRSAIGTEGYSRIPCGAAVLTSSSSASGWNSILHRPSGWTKIYLEPEAGSCISHRAQGSFP